VGPVDADVSRSVWIARAAISLEKTQTLHITPDKGCGWIFEQAVTIHTQRSLLKTTMRHQDTTGGDLFLTPAEG